MHASKTLIEIKSLKLKKIKKVKIKNYYFSREATYYWPGILYEHFIYITAITIHDHLVRKDSHFLGQVTESRDR